MPVQDLFGNKEQIAIERMKMFEPPEGYWLAFSGGRDSITLYDLAKGSGVKFDAHYNVTPDPPEVQRFIRSNYPDVEWSRPEMTMYQLIAKIGFPTRPNRCCCRILKERGGQGRRVLDGIRWAESVRRSSRKETEDKNRNALPSNEELDEAIKAGDGITSVEFCPTKGTTFVHPIIDWSDAEVWQYIREHRLPYCSLYDEGIKRIGCVMCPQGGTDKMQHDAARWPRIAAAYRRAFHKLWQNRLGEPSIARWKDADDMFEWWIGNAAKEDDIELPLFDDMDDMTNTNTISNGDTI